MKKTRSRGYSGSSKLKKVKTEMDIMEPDDIDEMEEMEDMDVEGIDRDEDAGQYMEDMDCEDREPKKKMKHTECKCTETGILAHAYVPWQCYETAFSPCEALMKGTLFPELWGVYPIPE
ncbi:MAG TPA: spore coat associated protein CotJA [Methylomusa anaerophila]|uniref:Spore coat associated protein JA n=1 Tax=Methylomusa anaerophila TaxID=1930071 RepID=A0A348AI03_9FIRM|nr:spore coat associated protein CotJA [Methylomusa anaerophila]BBB90701.1 Spore coat associated protein JA [Methylomusa anaerophila]HML88696.1 spore coat associated protein CotJA [Methylomusa anaerophila]